MANPRGNTDADRARAFGEHVRRLRLERGESQTKLAERIPMSPSNLSRLELGKQGPPPGSIIERIAKALEEAEPGSLLRAAELDGGRVFDDRILERLNALEEEVKELKRRLS